MEDGIINFDQYEYNYLRDMYHESFVSWNVERRLYAINNNLTQSTNIIYIGREYVWSEWTEYILLLVSICIVGIFIISERDKIM